MSAPRYARGFTLVEVTIALGIAAFCLVVVYGLLSVGLNTSSLSVEQTIATNLLSSVASDLRTAPDPSPKGGAATTIVYGLSVPPSATATPSAAATPKTLYLDANGQMVTQLAATYQLNVWFTPGVGRDATLARLVLTWPAITPLAKATSSVETVVALDRN